jgi:multiple sugar transport system substrate-binding protein
MSERLEGRSAIWMVAAVALVVACGGPAQTTRPSTAAGGSSRPASVAPGQSSSASSEPTATPTPRPTLEPFDPSSGDLRWYCCLGTGEDPRQVRAEKQIAADFGAANPGITLKFQAITYEAAYDTLSTIISGENPPDVVGPAGVSGVESFHGQWMDLTNLIASSGFDLSAYAPNLVDFFKTEDGQQIGLPFDVYSSVLWYSRSMFDEANLPYPPHKWGDPYTMPDGTQLPWNYDTVRQLALKLTVDKNGLDATQEGFDPANVEQWGFDPQRDDLRYLGSYWEPGSLLAEDGKTARVPEAWKAAWKWFYNGIWTDHFLLTGSKYDAISEPAGGFAFFTGRVAMSMNYLWTTFGLGADTPMEGDWDIAALPSYNGKLVSPINADTFTIPKGTQHPQEAFLAMTYLVRDRAADLLAPKVYGGMPAATADQPAYIDALNAEFPHGVDWQVLKDSLQYPDVPNSEGYMPKYSESTTVLSTYLSKWVTTSGLDMDAEIAALEAELQTTWDR